MRDLTESRASAKVIAGVFVTAGILHFTHTRYYLKIVPPYLPSPEGLVYVSGVAEIAGGVGVLVPRLRRPAGWALLALLVAVFPANLYHAMNPEQTTGDAVPPAVLWARLPFQAVFMAWVWHATLRRR